MTERRWLVTGCSSGLGRALAQRLADTGTRAVITARDESSLADLAAAGPHIVTAALDVTDPAQCTAAVQLAVERFGGLDVLVNNAGYGQFGVVEEVTDSELHAQLDANLYGPWRLVRAALPYWRAAGRGHAIFASSVSGMFALPGLSAYTASKHALEGLAESVHMEAGHLGVKVSILQLGGFSTSYGDKVHQPDTRIEAYRDVVAPVDTGLRGMRDNTDIARPDTYATVVTGLAAMAEPPLRLVFGGAAEDMLTPVVAHRQAALTDSRAIVDKLLGA
jgi:NAD(P)-dependent dehydrogenase (short-subunit alcohol dehydrogenase family)